MCFASSLCGSDCIESRDISWISSTYCRVLVVYLQFRCSSHCYLANVVLALGLNGSLLMFRNNPAWEKPTRKHDKITKCANWCLRKRSTSSKTFHRGYLTGKCVSVIYRPTFSICEWGILTGVGRNLRSLPSVPETQCESFRAFSLLTLFPHNGAVALHSGWLLRLSGAR